jgi:hypothetical protein
MWQKINEPWLSCHSWQDHERRMITAMTFLILLLLVAAVMTAATVRLVSHDGRGPQRPPASHFQDARFVAPLAR